MIELEAPEIFGHTVFCDDLRFELDGKITLVGSYNGTMLIRGEFPITLPKFAVSVFFLQSKAVYEPKLTLKVFLPGDSADAASVEVEVEPPPETPLFSNEEKANVGVRANIIMSPLVINSPGAIKVRMQRQGQLHPIGSLAVVAVDATLSNAPPPPS